MLTKQFVFGILITTVLAGPALAADKATTKHLDKMTCEEYLGLDESIQPKVVYWAVAYGKSGEPKAAVIDVDGIETAIPFIVEACKKAPKESFWHKVKEEMKKVEKKM